MSTTLEARKLGSRPRRWWLWRALRSLAVAAGVFALIWWLWPYVPDEVRCPPDVGWFSRPMEVIFSPDGKRAVTTHDFRSRRCWDLRNGTLIADVRLDASVVTVARFCGRMLATMYLAGNVGFQDVDTGHRPLRNFQCLHWLDRPDGSFSALGFVDGCLEIREVHSEKLVHRLPPEASTCQGAQLYWASLSEDGKSLLLRYRRPDRSQFTRLYPIDQRKVIDLPQDVNQNGSWRTSPRAKFMVWNSEKEKSLYLTHLEKCRTLMLAGFEECKMAKSVAFTEDESELAVLRSEGVVTFWEPHGFRQTEQLRLPETARNCCETVRYIRGSEYLIVSEYVRSSTIAWLNQKLAKVRPKWMGELAESTQVTWLVDRRSHRCYPLPWGRFAWPQRIEGKVCTRDDYRLYLWSLPPRRPWLLAFAWASGAAGAWWLLEAGLARSLLWLQTAKPVSSA